MQGDLSWRESGGKSHTTHEYCQPSANGCLAHNTYSQVTITDLPSTCDMKRHGLGFAHPAPFLLLLLLLLLVFFLTELQQSLVLLLEEVVEFWIHCLQARERASGAAQRRDWILLEAQRERRTDSREAEEERGERKERGEKERDLAFFLEVGRLSSTSASLSNSLSLAEGSLAMNSTASISASPDDDMLTNREREREFTQEQG